MSLEQPLNPPSELEQALSRATYYKNMSEASHRLLDLAKRMAEIATEERNKIAAERDKYLSVLRVIACDWVGIGTCPTCGLEHGAAFPRSGEDLLRGVARSAINTKGGAA